MSVLQKTSDLLDCLGQAAEPVTLAYVRSALAMPKSSTHRLLTDLAALGIVRRNEDGRYSLGPRLLYWGEVAAESFDLRIIAESSMRRLRDVVEESVHLYIREKNVRICIAAVEAHHELRPFIQLGSPLPLRAGAAGKLLLAFADPDVQDSELERANAADTEFPGAPGQNLASELAEIRRERWATSIGERQQGVSAIAAAVVDSRDRVVAALGISGPTARLDKKQLLALREPLEECAAEISTLASHG